MFNNISENCPRSAASIIPKGFGRRVMDDIIAALITERREVIEKLKKVSHITPDELRELVFRLHAIEAPLKCGKNIIAGQS